MMQSLWLKIATPFIVLYTFALHIVDGMDNNPLHNPNLSQTGVRTAAISKDISVDDLKDKAKKLGCTINDLIMAVTSVTMKEYFVQKGDEKTSRMWLAMPFSLRQAPDSIDSF